MWGGGASVYHIDHFAPKSKFEHLQAEYANLIYSCPYCNRAKSDDWVTDNFSEAVDSTGSIGYVDPCDIKYEMHFYRNSAGEIMANTALGEYMWNKLHLYLQRHKLIYSLNKIFNLKNRLRVLFKECECDQDRLEIAGLLIELDDKFDQYMHYLNNQTRI